MADSRRTAQRKATPPLDERPTLHVLVVEDDKSQRDALVGLLRELGCRVDAAVDGGPAVVQAARLAPDLVFMDLGMPNIDGWDAIRSIRAASKDRRPHVIALSAFDDARSRELAFEAGCDEYIVKPFDVSGAIRAFVARRGHRRLVPT